MQHDSRFNMQHLRSHQLQSTIVHDDGDAESQKSSAPLGITVNNEVDIESVYTPSSDTFKTRKNPDVFVEEA